MRYFPMLIPTTSYLNESPWQNTYRTVPTYNTYINCQIFDLSYFDTYTFVFRRNFIILFMKLVFAGCYSNLKLNLKFRFKQCKIENSFSKGFFRKFWMIDGFAWVREDSVGGGFIVGGGGVIGMQFENKCYSR